MRINRAVFSVRLLPAEIAAIDRLAGKKKINRSEAIRHLLATHPDMRKVPEQGTHAGNPGTYLR